MIEAAGCTFELAFYPTPSGYDGETVWQKLKDPRARIVIAQNFVMDWSMLWKDLAGGFLIAGALSAFVPAEFGRRCS